MPARLSEANISTLGLVDTQVVHMMIIISLGPLMLVSEIS
jgi:hypothetical protein